MTTPLTDDLATRWKSLDALTRAWLTNAVLESAAAREVPQRSMLVWELRFSEAGRHCRDTEHVARVLLLHAVRPDAADLARLYAHGTAAERGAVLRVLPHLPYLTRGDALPLVEDALRTNDTRLIAAAVGPYAARHLDAHAWRHAVLKCLFTGVPLDEMAELERRANGDDELARMLTDYAAERSAAGRPVPEDLHRALRLATQES
ncbi:sugar phosphate isomerase [Streptomyces fodineus]|uniref:Sugar phosphate isomerase n=1 Tax=Streptomyces fodineus TaxID=1904616 RepID=A0A1D7Y4R0_9ACTN|nr:EboA domain-containing protein [Streptomyces fodineus]AOR30534.1 sugar phosphate isomerase [Streptomyces fodineus]